MTTENAAINCPMIEVSGLTKRYENRTAVENLSFNIEKGHIYGFLGPNGAGKSTTMNILAGCLAASEGDVKIGGYDIFDEALKAKRLIGYLPEQPPLYLDMTPEEYLGFVAMAKGLSRTQSAEEIRRVSALTGISDVSRRLIRNLSKGYRQRVGIAQAILGDPAVIILDEPTVGLDPRQITETRDLIKSLGHKHTVILSSHILSEVRMVCDEIMIISKGRLVAIDTAEGLERLFNGKTSLELTVKAPLEEALAAVSRIDGAENVGAEETENGCVRLQVSAADGRDISEEVFFAFCDIRKPIIRMNRTSASLEEIYLELTRDSVEINNSGLAEGSAGEDEGAQAV
jgi:ABC-2 type transport system ATP-binding protein